MSIGTGSTLIAQLIDAATDPELGASTAIVEGTEHLSAVLAKARAVDVAVSLAAVVPTAAGDVELDQRADRTIKANMLRLQAAVLLDDGEPAERAADLLELLFPDGLAFTKATFAAQDAVMQRMLTLLEDPERRAALDELAGPKYYAAFEQVAQQYSAMVKAMGRVVPSRVDQRAAILEMQAAIVQHCSRVLGELRDADPGSVARTRALLAPIDNFRARQGSSARPAEAPAVEAPAPAPDEALEAAEPEPAADHAPAPEPEPVA